MNSTQNNNPTVEVSVIIPVRNEEAYIKDCIRSILEQDFNFSSLEVIFINGASEDGTAAVIQSYIQQYPFIRLLQNPQKTVQTALNIGILHSVGTYIVRMDAHSEYAGDYISKCLYYLKTTGAVNVGGPMVARGKTPVQKAVAAAYHSPFALGGGKFHEEAYEGYADTVYLGSFKRETILQYGLYDERFPRSEDDELNFRIAKSGGKIYINPEIRSVYYPRSSYHSLFKQYFQYGLWKVAVIKKHKKPARLSHLVPAAFVLFILLSAAAPILHPVLLYIASAIWALYLLLDFLFSFLNPYIGTVSGKLRLVYIHFLLHLAYGVGFWCGIYQFIIIRRINFNEQNIT